MTTVGDLKDGSKLSVSRKYASTPNVHKMFKGQ